MGKLEVERQVMTRMMTTMKRKRVEILANMMRRRRTRTMKR